jgi:hypothetical protein
MTQISVINTNGTFSKSQDTSDFQTENMKHKIRAVHKKKKNKNYKNIELLENIHESVDAPDKPKPVVEGLAVLPIATFEENDWTEGDNIYEGGRSTAPAKKFSAADAVNYLFDQIDSGINKIAKGVVYFSTLPNIAKNATDAEHDTRIVKKYVIWGIALIFATISVYNWAFLMVYKTRGERVELFDISRERLNNASYDGKIYALLNYLLDIPTFFPEKIQEYFVNVLPDFMINYTHVSGFFALLFIMLTRFFYTASSSIRTMLLDIVNVNMSNKILSLMYAMTFLIYVLSFFEFQPISTAISVVSLVAGFPASLIRPVLSSIFKVFFLIMFAVPIASSMSFLYLFTFSFFAIRLLGDEGFWSTGETIKKVAQYIKSNRLPIKEDTICKPLTFYDRIINVLNKAFNVLSINIINIGYITMLLAGTVDYMKHIKNVPLKITLIVINVMAIVVFGTSARKSYMEDDIPEETLPESEKAEQKPEDLGYMESVQLDVNSAANYVQNMYKETGIINGIKTAAKNVVTNITDKIKTTGTEGLNNIKDNYPTLGQDIKNTVLGVGEKIRSNVSGIGEKIGSTMPPNTDIAQQINTALKDGKKLVISLETDKPSALEAAAVASAP